MASSEPVLVLTRTDVERALDLDALVEAVGAALADLSAGRASMPPRIAAPVDERDAFLAAMPAYLPSSGTLATKLVSVFPGNTDRPTHQAAILCFDAETGTLEALMDGTYVTAARTAAGSALATRLLARADASTLSILGTGVQARAHARAVVRVRPFRQVRVAGRERSKARALAAELRPEFGVDAIAVDAIRDGVEGADVVCACTHSPDPVVRRPWVSSGTHVNSVGFNTAGREVDGETVAAARVFVESRASALADPPAGSNDLLWPIRDGLIGRDHVAAELGELVTGSATGRTSPDEITLYKSVGVAVEDAAAAALVLRRATELRLGTPIDL